MHVISLFQISKTKTRQSAKQFLEKYFNCFNYTVYIFPININSFKIMLGKKRQKSTGVICLALRSFLFLQSSLLPVKLLARNTKSYSSCRQNLRHVSFSFFKISCLVCQESIRLKSKNHSKLHLH